MKDLKSSNLKSFTYLENGEVTFSIFDTIKSTKVLDPGNYTMKYLAHPEYRVQICVETDEEQPKSIDYPERDIVLKSFEAFLNKEIHEKVKNIGFYHKSGLLVYGKEGTGKSSIIKTMCHQAISSNDAITIKINQTDYHFLDCWSVVEEIRKIQDNPIIIVLEEFDAYLEHKPIASFIKRLMDGDRSIDNCYFMATTNYIDSIPDPIKNRASRFKHVIEIKPIEDSTVVNQIITNLIGNIFTKEEIQLFSDTIIPCTIDEVKQFCLDKIMNLDVKKKEQPPAKIGYA